MVDDDRVEITVTDSICLLSVADGIRAVGLKQFVGRPWLLRAVECPSEHSLGSLDMRDDESSLSMKVFAPSLTA